MTAGPVSPAQPTAGQPAAAPAATSFARDLLRRPAAAAAVAFLLVLALACVLAPLIAPYGPLDQDLNNVLSGPGAQHLLGTDTLGRDVLSRLLFGGRRSMLSIVEAVTAVLLLGVPLGVIAGYVGGWTDRVITRGAEVFVAVPAIILVLVTLALVPENENAAMLVLGVLGAPGVLRVVRGATLQVRDDLYIAAARVSGVSHARIILRHVLPRIKGPIIVQGSLFASAALLFETGLGFLGLATNPLQPTWGGMVAEAFTVITRDSWLLYPSGATIALCIVALGVLGDAIRDSAATADGTERPVLARRARARRPADTRPAGSGTSPPSSPVLAAPDAVLDIDGLTVTVAAPGGDRILVDDVRLSVAPGETVGLLGESGCGKSITALAILRLLPPGVAISGGRVSFDGQDITAATERAFARLRGSGIGYVSQEPMSSLDPAYTVGAQLGEVVRRHDRCSRQAARARVGELLAQVKIPDPGAVAGKYPHELSGGMAQRVALAIALAGRPRLLIADEPTTALDVTVQSHILALLRDLQRGTGMAILLVTHDWGVVADICHRVVVMYAGQPVEFADAQAMFDEPRHPYTEGLLRSSPAVTARGERLPSMPGRVPTPGSWPDGCRFADRCRLVTEECRRATIPVTALPGGRETRCVHSDDLRRVEVAR
jgi:peptide/nickel transport system permease protein